MALVRAVRPMGRVMRRPQHRFFIKHKPWQAQPFLIAPVLPGETMRSLLLQARVVTDRLVNGLVGWWLEYYIFYVKHRDLDFRDDLTALMLDPELTFDEKQATSPNAQLYQYVGGVKWQEMCLKRVIEEFFRNEGEAWDDWEIDGLPAVNISQESFLDSLTDNTKMETLDVRVDVDEATTPDSILYSEIDKARRMYELLRLQGVTEMSYEDFLKSYGIRGPLAEDPHVPELIRYIRDWTYPANQVDAEGNVASACSWKVQERADKDRFFTEPGFIFGVTCARPKVYLTPQKGAAVGMLDNAFAWLPAMLDREKDYAASWKRFDDTNGPLGAGFDDYWVDVRDLWIYGDQFVNTTPDNAVGLPLADGGVTAGAPRYAADADAAALFTGDGQDGIRQDGVVSLHVASSQRDQSVQQPQVPLGA